MMLRLLLFFVFAVSSIGWTAEPGDSTSGENSLADLSLTCPQLISELAQKNILPPESLRIALGAREPRDYDHDPDLVSEARVPAYIHQVAFQIDAASAAQIAQQLSGDFPEEVWLNGITHNLANGHAWMPLGPCLPQRVQAVLGRPSTKECHFVAFNFHETPADRGIDPGKETPIEQLLTHYRPLQPGDRLQYGDLLIMVPAAQRSDQPLHPLHSMIFIGGDVVYHKLNPLAQVVPEFTTYEAIHKLYASRVMGSLQREWDHLMRDPPRPFYFGDPFSLFFYRYQKP